MFDYQFLLVSKIFLFLDVIKWHITSIVMNVNQVSKIWSGLNWLLIILGFLTEIQIYGVDIWIIILGSIIGRIIFVRFYSQKSQAHQQHQQMNSSPTYPDRMEQQPECPNCGAIGFADARFCEECGTKLDTTYSPESFN